MALSAIESVFDGIQNGRLPQLADRDDLWKLLVWDARCKVLDQRKHERRVKRGGGKVVSEADLVADDDAARPLDELDPTAMISQTARGEPTPEFAALVAEEYARRLDELGDAELRRIAELKLACFTDQEVAEAIGRSLRATTLRLEKIRKLWAPAG